MKNLAFVTACLVSAAALAGDKKPGAIHVSQPELTYVQPFGPKGPAFGFVAGKYGDKQPASFFAKLAAGGDSGWHFHDEEYSAIVIQGTFTEQQQGESEIQLPVGTYFTQPAKKVHRNGCLKGTDCLVFVHFDKGASSTPTTPDGKPVK